MSVVLKRIGGINLNYGICPFWLAPTSHTSCSTTPRDDMPGQISTKLQPQ